jgi:hypothetical protein
MAGAALRTETLVCRNPMNTVRDLQASFAGARCCYNDNLSFGRNMAVYRYIICVDILLTVNISLAQFAIFAILVSSAIS